MTTDLYINMTHLLEWLREERNNHCISLDIKPALLYVQQTLESQKYSPFFADYIEIGGCDACAWKNRKQKCSCCRRNRNLKDCFEEG